MRDIEKQIEAKVSQFLQERYPEFFLCDVRFSEKSQEVDLFIDKDSGITVEECAELVVQIREELRQSFPTDEPNWVITVRSPGIGSPLKFPRQFQKNVGRYLSVIGSDHQEWRGKLVDFDPESGKLFLQIYQKVKHKWIPKEVKSFGIDQIREAKVILEI